MQQCWRLTSLVSSHTALKMLTEQTVRSCSISSSSSSFFFVSRWSKSCSTKGMSSSDCASQVSFHLVFLKSPSRCVLPSRPDTLPDASLWIFCTLLVIQACKRAMALLCSMHAFDWPLQVCIRMLACPSTYSGPTYSDRHGTAWLFPIIMVEGSNMRAFACSQALKAWLSQNGCSQNRLTCMITFPQSMRVTSSPSSSTAASSWSRKISCKHYHSQQWQCLTARLCRHCIAVAILQQTHLHLE